MPLPPRPNPPAHVAHFICHGTFAGVNWANTFWLRNGHGTSPSAVDFQAVTEAFYALYRSAFKGHMNTGVVISGCEGIYYGPSGGDIGGSVAIADGGSLSGEQLTAQVATCISWRVQQRYRGGHPRTYLPPADKTKVDTPRLWTSSFANAVRDSANDFLDNVNTIAFGNFSDSHLGIVSFVLRKEWRVPPVFRDFIPDAAGVDARIDTQRRRLGADL